MKSNIKNQKRIKKEPFLKNQHRSTCSMIGQEKQQIVATFLQKQQQLGGKKLLFAMTTNCKGGLKQNYHLENNLIRIILVVIITIRKIQTKKIAIKKMLERFEMDVCNKNLNFIIQTNGQEVLVQKKGQKPKQYRLNELPQKLQKFYTYSKQVCNAIRERNQKQKINNEHGNFALKNTKLGQCFEGYIAQSKIKIQHILNSETIKLQLQNGTLKSININEFQQLSTQARYKSQRMILFQ